MIFDKNHEKNIIKFEDTYTYISEGQQRYVTLDAFSLPFKLHIENTLNRNVNLAKTMVLYVWTEDETQFCNELLGEYEI